MLHSAYVTSKRRVKLFGIFLFIYLFLYFTNNRCKTVKEQRIERTVTENK